MQEIDRLRKRLYQAGFPEVAQALDPVDERARVAGVPDLFPSSRQVNLETQKVSPEIPLRRELKRQISVIIKRVIKPLELDEQKALEQLSASFPERQSFHDKFRLTIPLLVPQFEGVSWLSAVKAARFSVSDFLREMINIDQVHPWQDPRRVDVPNIPHGIWVQDGTLFVNRRAKDVRKELENKDYKDLLAGTLWDGFALALLRPDMVMYKGWDLIGDSVGSGHIPYLTYLSRWLVRLGFGAHWDGYPYAYSDYRAFVCGR